MAAHSEVQGYGAVEPSRQGISGSGSVQQGWGLRPHLAMLNIMQSGQGKHPQSFQLSPMVCQGEGGDDPKSRMQGGR